MKTPYIRHHLLRIFLCLLAGNAVASVYKCPDASGKTKFQDIPCMDGTVVQVKPSMGHADPSASSMSTPYRQNASNDPLVGMGKNYLIQTLGIPDSTSSTSSYDGSVIESMMFMQHGKAITVYMKNGIVFRSTTIERDWIRQSVNRPKTRPCPSAADIRYAETNASSSTLTERERRNKQYDIARMKACVPY